MRPVTLSTVSERSATRHDTARALAPFVTVAHGSRRFVALGAAIVCRGFQLAAGQASSRLELPTGAVTMVFGFGGTVRMTDLSGSCAPTVMTSLVSGVRHTARIGEPAGELGGVEVSLTPMMAYSVFGADMYDLARVAADPVDVFGPAARRLSERLAECVSWEARFDLVDRLLTDRLVQDRRCCPDVSWAWQRLSTGSDEVMPALTDTGWSRRRMERRFNHFIGASPKSVAQVARLQQALRLFDTSLPLSRIAAQAGYFDQAHFTRAVRAMSGRTPAQLRAERAARPHTPRVDRLPGRITSVLLPD